MTVRQLSLALVLLLLALAALACSASGDGGEAEIIYVSATPEFDSEGNLVVLPTATPTGATPTPIQPTPNPTRESPQTGDQYVVQPGDTLGSIATLYGVTIEEIQTLNAQLIDPNTLEVGQTLNVPGGGIAYGPDFKLIPDSELIYSPPASYFNVTGFVKFQEGFLRAYSEDVSGEVWSGVQIVDFVARNYSVNPRLLLALLEYRGGWITDPYPGEQQVQYPLGIQRENRAGLMRQLLDAADALNYGYYGWKYRGRISLALSDGTRLFYDPGLNAGTVGVQYMLSVTTPTEQWQRDVHPDGFFETYLKLFGDPFAYAYEPLIPPDLKQPELTLPFGPREEWLYTGGPHGAYNSGSAWASIDFAPPPPPDELVAVQGSCYISPYWVTAAASGIIARSGDGYVVLDLDGDGNEYTGWTLVYLHIDDHERIAVGREVERGDQLGHPSCEGGYSNGTHLHFGRRYNGEWVPVQCDECAPGVSVPPLMLGEWTVYGYPGQEYQGYMARDGDDGYRQADQSREYTLNRIIW